MTESDQQVAIARRLEDVAERAGFRSLREFHQFLESSELDFSYTAIRNYHDQDPEKGRMPPVSYLTAICDTFGVNMEWLGRGIGPMYGPARTEEDEEIRRRIREVEGDHPDFLRWPEWAKRRALDLTAYAGAVNPVMLKEVVELVEEPFNRRGFRGIEELDYRERNVYFHGMLAALYAARRSYRETDYPEDSDLGFRVKSTLPLPGEED